MPPDTDCDCGHDTVRIPKGTTVGSGKWEPAPFRPTSLHLPPVAALVLANQPALSRRQGRHRLRVPRRHDRNGGSREGDGNGGIIEAPSAPSLYPTDSMGFVAVTRRDKDKSNCWEAMQCGREPGGSKVRELGVCPAATDTSCDGLNGGSNGGRICWAVSGSLCGGERQGTHAEKLPGCFVCRFFQRVRAEQGWQRFVLLKPGQTYEPGAY